MFGWASICSLIFGCISMEPRNKSCFTLSKQTCWSAVLAAYQSVGLFLRVLRSRAKALYGDCLSSHIGGRNTKPNVLNTGNTMALALSVLTVSSTKAHCDHLERNYRQPDTINIPLPTTSRTPSSLPKRHETTTCFARIAPAISFAARRAECSQSEQNNDTKNRNHDIKNRNHE